MKSSPLFSKPCFVSQFNVPYHAEYQASVAQRVREYFCANWPWASGMQKEAFMQYGTELWMMITCPAAPEDRAEIGSKYGLYTTALDDFFEYLPHDKAIQVVEGMNQVLVGGHPPRNALENIFHDMRSEMLSFGDARTREIANIMFKDIITFFATCISHVNHPDIVEQGLDEYLKYRFDDVGTRFSLGILAWQMDLSHPAEHVLKDADFDLLWSLSADHMILINDMFSYRREALLEERKNFCVFNSVRLFLREDGVDETNVMDIIAGHIRSKEASFVDAAERLRSRYKDRPDDLEAIEKWVVLFIEAMAGNHYWSSICGRYNVLDDSLFEGV